MQQNTTILREKNQYNPLTACDGPHSKLEQPIPGWASVAGFQVVVVGFLVHQILQLLRVADCQLEQPSYGQTQRSNHLSLYCIVFFKRQKARHSISFLLNSK